MELNRFNQLVLTESDEIFQERSLCPSCNSEKYSSIYMEKASTKAPQSWSIDVNSSGPSRIFFMKCACGNSWTEHYSETHHRPHIKNIFMKNY